MTSRPLLPSLCALLGSLFLAMPGCAADSESARVADLFAHLDEGVQPGAAVMVIKDGAVVFNRGFGYADLASMTPIDDRSAFRLASVTKQFTATAVMLLAEDGKLDYDDSIVNYLPRLSAYPGVTIRHLLTHTGGLPDYTVDFDTSGDMPVNDDVPALTAALHGPEFEPGTRYEYSNPSYELLALIVERVSGLTFAAFLQQRIFEPAGMTGSLVYDQTEPEIANRVYGYQPTADGFEIFDFDKLNHVVGAGGVYATLQDFIAWDRALYGDAVVSQATLSKAYTRHRLNDGTLTDYGFGWRVENIRGHRHFRHGGSWVGFRTAIARYTDQKLTIVLLSNRSDTEYDLLIDAISDIYLPAGGV